MAKIFISSNFKDRQLIDDIVKALELHGHTVAKLEARGVSLIDALSSILEESDVFMPVITDNSAASHSMLVELGMAQAMSRGSGGIDVIPLVFGGASLPSDLHGIMYIKGDKSDLEAMVSTVATIISKNEANKRRNKEEKQEQARLLEKNSSEYVKDAIDRQKYLESHHRGFGLFWYSVGFVSLLLAAGIAATAVLVHDVDAQFSFGLLMRGIGAVVLSALLGGCARYAFLLGKSYMVESLKNSDRIHAISFGEFYLKATGDKFDWAEIKDAFQHWNIDRDSNFSRGSTADFDPKLMEIAAELIKAVISRTEKS